ncbi:MAG: hypothetical protein ACK5MK_03000 [Dysgonomonas sp.]
MKFLNKLLLFAFVATLFASCGSDDDTDYTLQDKSEIIGSQEGTVKISLKVQTVTPYSGTGKTQFTSVINDNARLGLTVSVPTEIGGVIYTSNFKKSSDGAYYTFNVADFSTGSKAGGEIPTYITGWFPTYNISKIIIENIKTTNAKYTRSTQAISFTMSGTLKVYSKDASTGNEIMAVSDEITYVFTDLKK